MSVPPGFRFNAQQFVDCILPAAPIPPFTGVRMAIDPAYFSNPTSDESAYSVGFMGEEDMSFTLLDADSGRWKGIALPNKVVDAIGTWKPDQVWVEATGNGSPDLLKDNILMGCEAREIPIPQITFYTPRQSKAVRVFRLQGLVESKQLKICPGAYTSTLIQQARDFDGSSDSNRHRLDDMLDSLSAVCFAATF